MSDERRGAGGPWFCTASINSLLDSWGGVTIAYRRRLTDSPSYTLNQEGVAKAMEERSALPKR